MHFKRFSGKTQVQSIWVQSAKSFIKRGGLLRFSLSGKSNMISRGRWKKWYEGTWKKGLMRLFRWYESGLESSNSILKMHFWKSDWLQLKKSVTSLVSGLWHIAYFGLFFLLLVFLAVVLRPFLPPLAGYAPGYPWLWRGWRALGQ